MEADMNKEFEHLTATNEYGGSIFFPNVGKLL
jgi:hypothetical protein